jgi:hypothetical protein
VPPRPELPHAVIDPSALRAAKAPTVERRGAVQVGEAQAHPLIMAIPRFIQLRLPSPPLKPMDQSRRGVIQGMEAQAHPLIMAIPRFIQLVVDPSALRAAKAIAVE